MFGPRTAGVALAVLDKLEFVWRASYGDSELPDQVVDDILLLSRGCLDDLVSAAHLAVFDWGDIRTAADAERAAVLGSTAPSRW
jgi:hypothetical protein